MADKPRISPLHRFPDHVQTIGMITIEMCALEASLCHLLGAVLKIETPLAGALFFTTRNTRARIEILQNVMDVLVSGAPAKVAEKLVRRANSVLDKRNHIVHELWGVSTDRAEVVRMAVPYNKAKSIPLSELTDFLLTIRNLADEIESLVRTMWAAQRSPSHYIVNVTDHFGVVVTY